jgi:hypothetical protein
MPTYSCPSGPNASQADLRARSSPRPTWRAKLGGGVEEVLEVIEQEQQLLVGDVIRDPALRSQCLGDRVAHESGTRRFVWWSVLSGGNFSVPSW